MPNLRSTGSLIAAALLVLGGVRVAAAQAATPHYRVSLDEDTRVARVRLDLPAGVSRLAMDSIQAQHLPKGWGTFVSSIAAVGRRGPVAIEQTGPTTWKLADTTEPVTLRYEVDLAFTRTPWPAGSEQAGWRLDDALYIVGRALFIDSDVPGSRYVSFELPVGWRASVPWAPTPGDSSTFLAVDGTDLVRNSLVLGAHRSVRVAAGPFDLELALPGETRATAGKVEPALRAVLGAYLRLFPETPSTRYLMTFFRASADDGEAFTRGAAFTTADAVDGDGFIIWGNFLAHELFHYWNGQRIRGSAPRATWRWFAEGVTEYYANVTLAREGLISPELFLKKAERHLGNFLYYRAAPAFTPLSLSDAGRDTGVNRFAVYDGGWSVAFCLDGLMRERSGDRASLDDLMRALWIDTRGGKPGYTVPAIVQHVDRLAGGGAGAFVATSVETPADLPVHECLARVGLKGAFKSYAAEAFLMVDPAAGAAERARGKSMFGARR